MSDWPSYGYPAMRSNPYSIMSREPRGLFFVTCMETLEEAQEVVRNLVPKANVHARIYHRGEPLKA